MSDKFDEFVTSVELIHACLQEHVFENLIVNFENIVEWKKIYIYTRHVNV